MMKMLKNQHGVALITTLGVVAILLTAAVQVGRLTGDSAMKISSENADFKARQTAMSSIHVGMAILSRDAADNSTDSLQEVWADPEKLKDILQELGLSSQQIGIQIEDEMGKIQVNALLKMYPGNTINMDQRILLERFFTLVQKDADPLAITDGMAIINAMKDWLDSNDNGATTGVSGAESDYYESLDPPYSCANGPFNHLSELHKVKGMNQNILEQEIEKYFTVYGLDDKKNEQGRYTYAGKININTAPLQVLKALMPEGMDHLAQDLYDFRVNKASEDGQFNNLLETNWFERVVDFSEKEKSAFKKKIRYSTQVFRITCHVGQGDETINISAVVERRKQKAAGKWGCRILQLEQG